MCAALGAGAIQSGQASLTTGTVECVTAAFSKMTLAPVLRESNLCTYPHAAPGLFATLAYNLTGGNLLQWFRDEFCQAESDAADRSNRDVYDVIFERMAPEPSRLLALPYFTGSGTPYFDARTPGAILGLRLGTSKGEILRALLEGLAFELKLNLSLLEGAGIPVRELFAVGGGARSQTWLQLKADVSSLPIRVPRVTETGCLGGALLACSAVTGTSVEKLIPEWICLDRLIEPQTRRVAYYEDRFPLYQKSYEALRKLALEVF